MATVIVLANTSLNEADKKRFVEEIGTAVTESLQLPPQLKSITLQEFPRINSTPKDYEEITFFVYTAPGKPVEAKRALVRNIQLTAERVLAGVNVKTIVIIKEHGDENVGVGGQLRLDQVQA
ncbi:tautomerase family protein [Paenibacillus sp. IHBB 3054]|uniref:tautomerase family protein n=1 Tax=Paenibacillus sp. IHBB 3054 TaxID=3425689 RepID=UPI003F67A7E2